MGNLHVGQVIAIPVLTRHIETSSGKCSRDASLASNCVMADALRDRFPEATGVTVGGVNADFDLPGGVHVALRYHSDMSSTIANFDNAIDRIRAFGFTSLKQAIRDLRKAIPRTVHAEVAYLDVD